MKIKKQMIWSLLTASSLLVSSVGCYLTTVRTTEATTTTSETVYTDTLELYQFGDSPTIDYISSTKASSGKSRILSTSVEQTIHAGLSKCQTDIDITSYKLTPDELSVVMHTVLNTSPDLFYVSNGYGYSGSEGLVTKVMPQYTVTGTTLQQQKEFYHNQLWEILNQIDPSWSDLEKILFTHDYLAQNFEYDTSYSIYDTYNFFKEKRGVCEAYTLTFIAVMNELGIETSVASSDAMGHIWNLVKLDGNWYHIDNTWDDPVTDKFGLAGHNNLLLSDNAIATCRGGSTEYHHNWSAPYKCTDTTYDTYFWENSNSPFQYLDGLWYYTYYDKNDSAGVLATYDFQNKKSSNITSLGKWFVAENKYYANCFSGLDVYNKKIFYNTNSAIFTYNPASGAVKTDFTPQISGSIFGMRIDGQTLYFADADAPGNAGTLYHYTLEEPLETPAPIPTFVPDTPASEEPAPSKDPGKLPGGFDIIVNPSFPPKTPEPQVPTNPSSGTLGDSDADGTITLSDAQLALKAALKITALESDAAAVSDVDADGTITLSDAQLILKYALKIISSFN